MGLLSKESLCRYGFSVAVTLVVTWARVQLAEPLGDRVPFGMYYISVLLSAWLCGVGPAYLSLLLGLVASTYCVFPPKHSFELNDAGDVLSLSLYFLVGTVAIALIRRGEHDHAVLQKNASACEAMSQELCAADRRKDEFLALLAHELRNPLATLAAGIEALDRVGVDGPRGVPVLASMRRQSKQLIVIVNDLLDVSSYLRGRLALACQPIDLREVIDDAIEIALPILDHHQHTLRFTRPQAPIAVDADAVRLTQVIVNLLVNAAKYTPPKGRVLVHCEVEEGAVSLHVIDNGIGIAPEAQASIFELFMQANPTATRDGQGLGIGLALVKQIVQMHDGRVSVVSDGPGRGSRFIVALPTVDADRLTIDAAPPEAAPSDAAPVANGCRVLVVDDNTDAAETLAAVLEIDGYLVEIAHDGHTAVGVAVETRPDAILLDIGMPGMDGYETARQLRAAIPDPSLRIIAVSGWGGDDDRRRSRAAGIDYHLCKPVRMDELASVLPGETLSPVGIA